MPLWTPVYILTFFSAKQFLDEAALAAHDSAEVSPKSGLVIEEISKRIVEFGGSAIVAGRYNGNNHGILTEGMSSVQPTSSFF
jgi:hypothetical protein